MLSSNRLPGNQRQKGQSKMKQSERETLVQLSEEIAVIIKAVAKSTQKPAALNLLASIRQRVLKIATPADLTMSLFGDEEKKTS